MTFSLTLRSEEMKGKLSHHQGLVHVVLSARAAVVVLGVDGEAEEENVYYDLKDGEEAVGHQEGEDAHDDERQHPDGVFTLIVQRQDTRKRRTRHDQHLQTRETTVRPSGITVCQF